MIDYLLASHDRRKHGGDNSELYKCNNESPEFSQIRFFIRGDNKDGAEKRKGYSCKRLDRSHCFHNIVKSSVIKERPLQISVDFETSLYAQFLRQAQISILEIVLIFLQLIHLRRIAFLELEHKLPFIKGRIAFVKCFI